MATNPISVFGDAITRALSVRRSELQPLQIIQPLSKRFACVGLFNSYHNPLRQILCYHLHFTVKETEAQRGLDRTATKGQDLRHLALEFVLLTTLLPHGAGAAHSPLSQLDTIDFSIQPTSLICFYRYLSGTFDVCSVLI